jgi:hypothetical protein
MVELPELRTIANSNGGSTVMFSNGQRSNSPEGVLVLSCHTFSEEAGVPRKEAARASNDPGSESQERPGGYRDSPAWSRAAGWTSQDPNEREVFNVWARSVAAFYSLIIISLLVAMSLGAHTPAGPKALSASAAMERGSPGLSVPQAGSTGK